MSESKYVTTVELANHFKVAVATITNKIRSGEIPPDCYVRVGKVYRLNLQMVEDHFRAQQERASEPDKDPEQGEFDFNQGDEE